MHKSATILLVEDERIVALDFKRRLEGLGYQVVGSAADSAQALTLAATHKPDLALMDINIHGSVDGIETARRLREEQDTPVVFLSAYAEDNVLQRALATHPFGYLVKPVDTRELHATIQTALARREAEQEQAKSGARIQHLAYHDPLTGLPNRLLFNDRLDLAIERAKRAGTCCAVLFIDLDGFKSVNDQLGHDVGDRLLQTLAQRIHDTLRRADTVARLGGDEFVVLMEDISHEDDIMHLARKLLDATAAPVPSLAPEPVRVSASIGIGVFPGDAEERHALLKAADAAMYRAKARGRNQACLFAGG